MEFIQKITEQLNRMSEEQKDQWILDRAKLCKESGRQGFLQSLTGEKRVPYMPGREEIEEFCRKVEDGDIYVEYETHYYEFDDDGRYMDDWMSWHNDPFSAMSFWSSIFRGCHDLLVLGEYRMAADILDRVCRLKFEVVEAQDSDEYGEKPEGPFTLADAVSEDMLSMELVEIGMDWVRAVIGRAAERGDSAPAREIVDLLENPVCENIHPHMLPEDEFLEEKISAGLLEQMEDILEGEIREDERIFREKYADIGYSHEKIVFMEALTRKKEILLSIRLMCRKEIREGKEELSFVSQWKLLNALYELLSGRYATEKQWEAGEMKSICESLLKRDDLDREDWELRKKVLSDIVRHRFYEKAGCKEPMDELAERLWDVREEALVYADMLEQSGNYGKEAALLYHQYGREDKYISYLEAHLGKVGKVYAELTDCYHKQGKIDKARDTAILGLQQCRDDLTDLFIWLLTDARSRGDMDGYKKLYASAKRRQGADINKIDMALKADLRKN